MVELPSIYNKCNRHDTSNCRQTCLLSELRVMEQFIRGKINRFLSRNESLSHNRYDLFRSQSSQTNLLSSVNDAVIRMVSVYPVEICNLDFQRTFELVNHVLPLLKMGSLDLAPRVTRWIAQYAEARGFI